MLTTGLLYLLAFLMYPQIFFKVCRSQLLHRDLYSFNHFTTSYP